LEIRSLQLEKLGTYQVQSAVINLQNEMRIALATEPS